MPESKAGSSARATHASNHGTVSPACFLGIEIDLWEEL